MTRVASERTSTRGEKVTYRTAGDGYPWTLTVEYDRVVVAVGEVPDRLDVTVEQTPEMTGLVYGARDFPEDGHEFEVTVINEGDVVTWRVAVWGENDSSVAGSRDVGGLGLLRAFGMAARDAERAARRLLADRPEALAEFDRWEL